MIILIYAVYSTQLKAVFTYNDVKIAEIEFGVKKSVLVKKR